VWFRGVDFTQDAVQTVDESVWCGERV
jgi:hypothetical protein